MKKGSKRNAILFAVLFIVIFFAIQIVVAAIGSIIATILSGITDANEIQAYIVSITPVITFITEIIMIVVFGAWYYLAFVKKDKAEGIYESGFRKIANVKGLCFIVVLAIAGYFLVLLISTVVGKLFPSFGELFNSIMGLTIGEDSMIGYITVMLLAPIAEELAFRGVLLKKSKQAFGFVGCVVINTIAFSLIHANPMQMIYVIPLGIVLTYLAYRYNSVVPSTIAHIINNSMSIILALVMNVEITPVLNIVLLVVFAGLTALAAKFNPNKEESLEC